MAKYICSEDRNEEIGDGHPSVRRRARAGVTAMRHREPVDSVHRKCHARHVEGRRIPENVEPSQANDEIYAGEKLTKARHPKPPHPHGAINFRAGFGIAEKSLPAPDE